MFCVNCGNPVSMKLNELGATAGTPVQEGELICKGCSALDAELREELLSLIEKENAEEAELKCKKCGAVIGENYRFCNKCGAPT